MCDTCTQSVKPIALGKVMNIARTIQTDYARKGLSLSGIGGIDTGSDAAEFILLGSDTVQVEGLQWARVLQQEGCCCCAARRLTLLPGVRTIGSQVVCLAGRPCVCVCFWACACVQAWPCAVAPPPCGRAGMLPALHHLLRNAQEWVMGACMPILYYFSDSFV